MSTQGILSITRNGAVAVKVVAGCNGYNIPALAEAIRQCPTTDVDSVHALCIEHKVGCNSCLVVQNSPDGYVSGIDRDDRDAIPATYKAKFADPKFNPRWEHGTAEFTEIVEIGEGIIPGKVI